MSEWKVQETSRLIEGVLCFHILVTSYCVLLGGTYLDTIKNA